MSTPEVIIHRDASLLAKAAAARLVTRLVDAVTAHGSASLVLTGGGIGTAVLTELAATPARDAVDWRHVDIWWGDERFEPEGDPERNETGAREALLDRVDVDPARVHPMAPSNGPDGDDPEQAADRYAEELARAAKPEDHGPVPEFDIMLLGIGPEGHVASLFPGMPALYDERSVVAVRGAPKPPPTRISLTFPAITAAQCLGSDPAADYRASAGAVLAAFSADGVLDRRFPLPEFAAGPDFPARQAVSFHFIDYVVHSWDVAKSLGLEVNGVNEVNFAPELLEAALRVAQAVPGGKSRLAPGSAFAPAVAWQDGSPLDRIVAVLGRSPDWKRPRLPDTP